MRQEPVTELAAYCQRRSAATGSSDHPATPLVASGPPATTGASWL